MKFIKITNQSRTEVQPVIARYCRSFFCQLRGLMFTKKLPDQHGLLLVQGSDSRIDASIHMMFMWMDLAVFWINTDYKVVDSVLAKRWRLAYLPKEPARYVLEIGVDHLGDFCVGDIVQFSEITS